MLVREGLVHESHVVKHRVTAAPWLVPVKTNAPNVLCRFRIGQDRPRSLINQIAVMVPDNDFLIVETFLPDRRAEMILEKISLFLGGENARLPLLRRHRLVLNTHAPDRYAFPLVSFNELYEVVG